MTTFKSDFMNIMQERGFFFQATSASGMDALLCEGPQVVYNGYDPTADSLHVGHLVTIMMLYWMQQTGHKPLVLMGGATGLIGDPSFKDKARPLMTQETIAANIAGIESVFSKILKFGNGTTDAETVNNYDWFKDIGYIEFLRDYGSHFSVNRMLSFESVKIRLEREQNLSFLEFNYMLFQAFDFVKLYETYGCRIQTCGADQWGNVVNGVELGRRKKNIELFGYTAPLLTTASGQKMGKSEGNAVWLNEDKLSHFDFYQFWRNADDADVGKMLKIFTPIPMDEIARLEKLEGQEINEAKKILAFEVTKLVRGEKAAQESAQTAQQTFEAGTKAEGLPSIELSSSDFSGKAYADLFIAAGLAKSKGEFRRLAAQGGAKVNDKTITEDSIAAPSEIEDGAVKLSAGKKRHALVKVA